MIFNTMVYERKFDTGAAIENIDSMAFNRDGTKLYTFDVTADVGNITTYSLPGPFDISSQTSINVSSMMDIGVIDVQLKALILNLLPMVVLCLF